MAVRGLSVMVVLPCDERLNVFDVRCLPFRARCPSRIQFLYHVGDVRLVGYVILGIPNFLLVVYTSYILDIAAYHRIPPET